MRSSVKMIGCSLVFLVFWWTIAISIPIPIFDVPDLVEKADLIPVGQILSVRQEGLAAVDVDGLHTQIRTMVAEMRVDQVLKGRIDSSQLRFEFTISDA